MAINKNFVVKNGLEVNTNQIFADSSSGKVGIGSTLPTVELDVTGAIAATDVTSSLLRVTGYSTLPQTTVNDNLTVLGFTTATNEFNVLGISSLSNTRVVGVTTFENNVNLDGNVNVTGFSTFVGLTSVVGNLRVSGFTTFSNQIIIEDNSDVFVTGVVTATRFDGAFSGTGINIGIHWHLREQRSVRQHLSLTLSPLTLLLQWNQVMVALLFPQLPSNPVVSHWVLLLH